MVIINEAAKAYGKVLEPQVYHELQMTLDKFLCEANRIKFFVAEMNGKIVGVACYEYVKDVALIRHVYVKPENQRKGIGTVLLKHLESLIVKEDKTEKLIVGTYNAAYWAIAFHQKHGYGIVENSNIILKKYYNIPDIQREELNSPQKTSTKKMNKFWFYILKLSGLTSKVQYASPLAIHVISLAIIFLPKISVKTPAIIPLTKWL